LVFLLGKGGVGRSTLAAALGVLAARSGRRAIVVEVSGRGDVPRLFGVQARGGFSPAFGRSMSIRARRSRSTCAISFRYACSPI